MQAQQAVDYLGENNFPIQNVTIVGTDLRMVERVTGRMSYGRAAMAGAGSGAWFGLFVGLLMSMFGGGSPAGTGGLFGGTMLVSMALGAGMGLMLSVLSYGMSRGRRDFSSQSQIVAGTYAILCAAASANEARNLLLKSPNGVGILGAARTPPAPNPAWGQPTEPKTVISRPPEAPLGGPRYGVSVPTAEPQPVVEPPTVVEPAETTRPIDPRWTTPDGQPRYGAMRPTEQPTPSVVAETDPYAPPPKPHDAEA